ncbi:MAG: M36 family metallopeptidase [Pseudomonadota bacterium]
MKSKDFSAATLLGLALTASAYTASAALPNVDAFRKEANGRDIAPPANLGNRFQKTVFDRQLGKPTFLWAKPDAAPIAVGPLASTRDILIEQARTVLRSEAANLGLDEQMISGAKVFDAQYNGNGPAVVRFRQVIAGREVFSRSLNVILDRAGKPVAVSGYFASGLDAASMAGPAFSRTPAQAIALAAASLGDWGGALNTALILPADAALDPLAGTFQWFKAPALIGGSQVWERMPRVKATYYPRADNRVEPAYYIELFSTGKSDRALSAYGVVVSATTGQVLHRRNLVSNATPFTYTVFADGQSNNFHPFDSPLGNGYTPFPGADPLVKPPRVATLTTAPKVTLVASNGLEDPWLPDGATTTTGNNTDACIDVIDSPTSSLLITPADVITNSCLEEIGDIRPPTTSANTFDYALAPDENPSNDNARNAAAVSLFYINNWLHDWWYPHGFNEEAGNAQTDNYGRGGEEADPIKAQGQDASGRNNANMGTPADGSSPAMQQYLFDGPVVGFTRQTLPNTLDYVFGAAAFGPDEYDIPATSVVLADDGSATPSLTDGCGESTLVPDPSGLGLIPTNLPALPDPSLAGLIVLIDRGSCNFTTKARFAQLSGAAAMVVINNSGGEPISMGNADLPIDVPVPPLPAPIPPVPGNTNATYTIPSVMIRKADGDAIKALLAAGTPVQMALHKEPAIDLDGTLDNQIVAHEFFHYVHNRLTDSSNQQSGAMGEGWGDIDGFMLSTRPEDRLIPGNDKYQGAYQLAGYVVNSFYSGIRRAPFSTDMSKNAYTLKHLSDGTVTPDGGPGTSNSEVHNAGEIWANQVWECYVGLLNRHPFADAQLRMKDYIIAGLKGTPTDATFVEARDAILAAAKAADNCDYLVCASGFAKRGAGPNAEAPARDSTDLLGVTEDFTPFGEVCPALAPPVVPPVTPPGTPPTTPPGSTPTPPVVVPSVPVATAGGESGRFGGGAMGMLLLLPLLGLVLSRRRRSLPT